MAKQTFVADAILTAAQMNALQSNDFNQTVSTKTTSYTLVASDAGTKVVMNSASATTITVNTSLFAAGDTLTILNIGAGVCTVTAGTATVSTTGTLALVQNAGGTLYFTSAGVSVFQADGVAAASAAGLVVVKAETAFTSVTTVTADSIFSSTHTNYRIIITLTSSTTGSMVEQLRVGGVTTTANYDFQGLDINNTTVSAGRTTAASSFGIGTIAATTVSVVFDFFQPNLAAATGVIGVTAGMYLGNVTSVYHTGRQTAATAFDGIIFTFSTASTGTFTVYGYGKSL